MYELFGEIEKKKKEPFNKSKNEGLTKRNNKKKNQEPFSKSKNEGLTKEKKNQEPFNKSKNDGLIIMKKKVILNNVNVCI